jgi:pimeloyl-ACP methyl ester carboxylesterase
MYPKFVDSVILISPILKLSNKVTDTIKDALYKPETCPHDEEMQKIRNDRENRNYVDVVDKGWKWSFSASYDRYKRYYKELGNTRMRTLIIYGSKDAFTDLSQIIKMKQYIPSSQVKIIKYAGHNVVKEARRDMLRDITEFLGH